MFHWPSYTNPQANLIQTWRSSRIHISKYRFKRGFRTRPLAQPQLGLFGYWLVPIYETQIVRTRQRPLEPNILFDPDGFDLDEPGSICRLESAQLVHRGLLLIIQTLTRIPKKNINQGSAHDQHQSNLPPD